MLRKNKHLACAHTVSFYKLRIYSAAADSKSELESLSILDDVVVIESFCIPYLILLGVEKLLIRAEL